MPQGQPLLHTELGIQTSASAQGLSLDSSLVELILFPFSSCKGLQLTVVPWQSEDSGSWRLALGIGQAPAASPMSVIKEVRDTWAGRHQSPCEHPGGLLCGLLVNMYEKLQIQ